MYDVVSSRCSTVEIISHLFRTTFKKYKMKTDVDRLKLPKALGSTSIRQRLYRLTLNWCVINVIHYVGGLVQERRIPIANALGLRLSCTNPSLCYPSGYGLTETSAVTHVAPIHGWKHGSVGILLPNMECKVSVPQKHAITDKNQADIGSIKRTLRRSWHCANQLVCIT